MPSSVIKRYEYSAAKKVLRIWFVSGAIYEYERVPATVFNSFRTASSRGRFLHLHIKGKFAYCKLC
jgi:hypothetical protein